MRASVPAIVLIAVLAGCQGTGFQPEGRAVGRIDTPDQAAAAALVLTGLLAPVTVRNVRSGLARDIYTGAYPSWPFELPGVREQMQRFQEKLDRQAWRVHLSGNRPPDETCCVWEELVIDRETGSVLFQVQADGIPEEDR